VNILEQIVKAKKLEVRRIRQALREFKARAKDAGSCRPFRDALRRKSDIALIAEIKRASPAKGDIRPDLDPAATAKAYEEAGAAAISCLTDKEFFKGSLDDFKRAREATSVPMLRKEFIIDESQVWQSKAAGADCILLIARILDKPQMKEFAAIAAELGMASLLEIHDGRELEAALDCRPGIVGINNRNLDTFEVNLETTARLTADIPPTVTVVAESGVHDRKDMMFLKQVGAHAALVGEEIARSADPGSKIRELLGIPAQPKPRIRLV
jgi:indole-3-glycerol phosphate synthase